MRANVGDRLILEGTHVGDPRRVGVVTAVRNAAGGPPYVVRWLDSERESLVFPGADARVETGARGQRPADGDGVPR